MAMKRVSTFRKPTERKSFFLFMEEEELKDFRVKRLEPALEPCANVFLQLKHNVLPALTVRKENVGCIK